MNDSTKKVNKTKAKRVDQLNDWEFCNPSLAQDQLPQPYRFLDKCLQNQILKPVYERIFEIEKQKNDPNYEGQLKEFQFSGYMDIEGITALSEDSNYLQNMSLVGDSFGNVYLLDLDKKIKCHKHNVANKEVLAIHSTTFLYKEGQLTTFAVILKGDSTIYVYRFLWEEKKFHLHYTIDTNTQTVVGSQEVTKEKEKEKGEKGKKQDQQEGVKEEKQRIGEFPYGVKVSGEGRYVVANLYNGNVVVYELPDPPINKSPDISAFNPNQTPNDSFLKLANNKSSSNFIIDQESVLNIPPTKINSIYYKMNVPFPVKAQSADNVVDTYLNSLTELYDPVQQALIVQQQINASQQKDAKKPTKTADQPPPVEQIIKEKQYETNAIQYLGDQCQLPFYRGEVFFMEQEGMVEEKKKQMRTPQMIRMTVQVCICWVQTKKWEVHQLQEYCGNNLPDYLVTNSTNGDESQSETTSVNISQGASSEKIKLKKEAEEHRQNVEIVKAHLKEEGKGHEKSSPQLKYKGECIYSIEQSAVSVNQVFMAIGLKDGTVIVHDLELNIYRHLLDKHTSKVTSLRFLGDSFIVSGGLDGSVHVHCMQTGRTVMKRTNLFRQQEPYSVIGMAVSSVGLAVVLDSLGNARAYDVFHQQKVFKYSPVSMVDSNSSSSFNLTNPLLSAKAEQTLILGYKDQNPTKTSLLIYKNFENLLNLYPGLSNLCRKGVERSKLGAIFPNLTSTQLINRDLEITMDMHSHQMSQDVFKNTINKNPKNSILKQNNYANRIPSEKSMSTIDMNSSFHSKVKQVQINKIPQKLPHNNHLTYEALNRENIYYSQSNQNMQMLYNVEKHTIQKVIETIKKKQIQKQNYNIKRTYRQNNVEKAMAKIEGELKLQEEQRHLEKRQKMLQGIEK